MSSRPLFSELEFSNHPTTRREAIKLALLGAAALTTAPALLAQAVSKTEALSTRAIPKTGERLAVIGLGTNKFGVQSEGEIAPLREVIRLLVESGARLVDTARIYGGGRSEEVLGEIFSGLRAKDRVFITSKVRASSREEAKTMLEASFKALRVDHVQAMLVHSLGGTAFVLPVLREWKQAGRIKYVGVSTSEHRQYEEMERVIRGEELDFLQIDYSVINRRAADRILPLAQDRGLAISINRPLGGRNGNFLPKLAGRPLPDFAAEIGATSWAQICLKYILAHPAVTAVIPGTTEPRHMIDNLGAGRGGLPNADLCRRIERIFDDLA